MKIPAFDIRHKLAGLSFALVTVVVVMLTLYFCAQHVETAEKNLEAKARLYASLLSRETESAVAFNDKETAREVFEAASSDADVRALVLYGATGNTLGASGESILDATPGEDVVIKKAAGRIGAVTRVISREGPRGVLVVEMSTASIQAEKRRIMRTATLDGLAALVVSLIASWLLGGSIARRLRRIQSATTSFAEGKLDAPPIVDRSRDEIGRLAGDFNTMAERIRTLVSRIETSAAEEKARLDELVALRTSELTTRNEDLKFLLDNVGQGFVTVDQAGALSSERSAVLGRWFGDAKADVKIWEYIARHDVRGAQWLEVGWEALFAGWLPFELAVDQLPKELRAGDLVFRVAYRPIMAGDAVEKVILVISDITAEIGQAQAEAAQQELAAVFARLVADPSGVQEFLEEGGTLIASIQSAVERGASLEDQKRSFHTLKGNSAFLGLLRLSSQCHDAETEIVESEAPLSAEACERLMRLWEEFSGTITPLVGKRRDRVEVKRDDLTQVVSGLVRGDASFELARRMTAWMLEPAEQRLERVAAQVRSVAEKLGKGDVEVVVEGNGVRLDSRKWASFWTTLIHVVRNSVDHGIEDVADRAKSGKKGAGKIVIRTALTNAEEIVEIEDDGRGIDWGALRRRADSMGLHASPEALEELLFTDGISTKLEVSEISGRGVGLGASRAACVAMGGRVEVTTKAGVGTKFTFRVPRTDVVDVGVAHGVARRPSTSPACA